MADFPLYPPGQKIDNGIVVASCVGRSKNDCDDFDVYIVLVPTPPFFQVYQRGYDGIKYTYVRCNSIGEAVAIYKAYGGDVWEVEDER